MCNNFYVMISAEISAGKVPEISIMIIQIYFDEFVKLIFQQLLLLFHIKSI